MTSTMTIHHLTPLLSPPPPPPPPSLSLSLYICALDSTPSLLPQNSPSITNHFTSLHSKIIKTMSKFKKSQILMLSFVAALLSVTPLIPSSLRSKYLYFIINLLIIALGAEAGLLSVFSKPLDDRKHQASATPVTIAKPVTTTTTTATPPADQAKVAASPPSSEKRGRVMEKSASEKVVSSSTVVKIDKVKKCQSTPSIFFIGSGDTTDKVINDHIAVTEDNEDDEGGEEVGGLSGQELFAKAETFIGNFYKQLKMQREESWKKIHGFYQKAF